MTIEQALEALKKVTDPDSGKDIARLGLIRELTCSDEAVSFTVYVSDPLGSLASTVVQAAREAILGAAGKTMSVHIELDHPMIGLGDDISIDGEEGATSGREYVLNTVAVASGKGGVGKSTVAVNLSIALARAGYSVGILDADIYGPSIPTMFGLDAVRPRVNEKRRIIPPEQFGVRVLSMGFLVDPEKAVIWRGPMVSSAIRQFLDEAEWGPLDFLILDLPPGTGDIQLTIVQTIALSGAIVVSTPQKVALADAKKGVAMFDEVNVPVLGIVENMAYFTPEDLPDRKYYIFGKHGARQLADDLNVPLLAELPLQTAIRESGDCGVPVAVGSDAFDALAKKVASQVMIRNATRPATEKINLGGR